MATSPSETSRTLHPQVSGASSADIDPSIPIRGPEHISDEEGPWAQKTILTFDGGGVRGYASLLVLKRIMTRIRDIERNHEDPAPSSTYYPWMGKHEQDANEDNPESERVDKFLPCHYFDYVAGTSTGGLSSIMLGRLRMSVDQALDTYKAFGNAVFGKPRWFHERSFLCEAETEPLKYREDRTRTIAISWAINKEGGVSKEFVWRSYDNDFSPKAHDSNLWNPSNAGPAHTTAIWEVARATTAAPRYFESIKIRGRKFLDGGMVANNPALIAIREIHNLHGLVPALFVSIGTGLKISADAQNNGLANGANGDIRTLRRAATRDDLRRKQFLKKYIEIGKHWKNWMVDCEGMNGTNGWRGHCRAIGLTEHLYRLNVEGDLHTIPLDDWRPSNTGEDTLKFIKAQTERYLAEPRWERFAVDVIYRCSDCDTKKYDTRAKLREHLQKGTEHRRERMVDGRELEEKLSASRSFRPDRPGETGR
ncbi:Calcium-independent phospholipase A2-gamma [Fusarium oxysporum f. sp. cubense race 1]|uniref:Calcium-independent phospholipase A2-gamma n=1 Tax=Fusarium oxysporum f. sp. cubense (strain race 1) TaxID=1229664 RepID=N4UCT0_FUSC1|nr:Calcium-independent phospholipase A2-gamma [Fusarium oxysporum f. sp. cubense race 1]